MLTSLPVYDTAAAIGDQAIAAIQQAFPTLEAQHVNGGPTEGLTIQVRNPLNGDCWTNVGFVTIHERYDDHIQVYIGNSVYTPAARFASTPKDKKPLDPAVICRTIVEYIGMERSRQEANVARAQARKASTETAKRLNLKLQETGLPTGMTTLPFMYFGVNRDNSGNCAYSDVPEDAVVVTFHISNGVFTPEVAEQIIELWKPIGQLLINTPSLRDPGKKCPAAGTLVN